MPRGIFRRMGGGVILALVYFAGEEGGRDREIAALQGGEGDGAVSAGVLQACKVEEGEREIGIWEWAVGVPCFGICLALQGTIGTDNGRW
jgi:hypothetical protein